MRHWLAYEGVPLWRHPKARGLALQLLVVGLVLASFAVATNNVFENLESRGVSTGFGFLVQEAGFFISETLPIPNFSDAESGALFLVILAVLASSIYLVEFQHRLGRLVYTAISLIVVLASSAWLLEWKAYDYSSTYMSAIVTGVLNTVNVAAYGCALGTIFGVTFGFAQLSSNWLLRNTAYAITNTARNIPLLLQVVFWYFAVLKSFPSVRDSFELIGNIFVNNRGVYFPTIQVPDTALGLGLAALAVFAIYLTTAVQRQPTNVKRALTLAAVTAMAVATVWALFASNVTKPKLEGFNFVGGWNISPEYSALLLGLVIYHGSFIADIVYAGIRSVPKGQSEAALSLSLSRFNVARYVVFPQALRVMVPPLSLQYLGIMKNTSIGVAIAFPELVSVSRTVLNQSGQAIEVMIINLIFYLVLSLLIAFLMNKYNKSVQLH